MSDSSTIGSLFDAQRTIIGQTFETQETINRQGLDLTRRAVGPLFGATMGTEEDVDETFARLDDTQAQMLEEAQHVAEQPVDASEELARWSVDFFDTQVGRFQSAGESAGDVAGEVAESAESTAEEAAETTEETAEEAADTAEDVADSTTDVAEDVVEDLQAEVEAATDEFDALEAVDETAVQGLAGEDIETLTDLASAQVEAVADAASTTQAEAEEWIEAAVEYEDVALADLEGIGETYSDRLAASGIRTIDQLARTSAAEVADVAGVDEDRAGEWIQQAQAEA